MDAELFARRFIGSGVRIVLAKFGRRHHRCLLIDIYGAFTDTY